MIMIDGLCMSPPNYILLYAIIHSVYHSLVTSIFRTFQTNNKQGPFNFFPSMIGTCYQSLGFCFRCLNTKDECYLLKSYAAFYSLL